MRGLTALNCGLGGPQARNNHSFMKEYENASQDDVLGMMDEYTDYLKQYTETMSKMEALDDGDLSTEEALYYAEVTNRISKKLIEVAQ